MKRFTVILVCVLWAPLAALSQGTSLDARQLEGMRHFKVVLPYFHARKIAVMALR